MTTPENPTDTVDRPASWSSSENYDFEVEAKTFAFPDHDVVLEAGDVLETPDGQRTFERAVRNTRGAWTLLYKEGSSHGPGYLGMMLRRGEWVLAEDYEGVQEL